MSPQNDEPKSKTDAEEIVDLKKEAGILDTKIKQLDDVAHQYGLRQMVAEAQVLVLTEELNEAKKGISELEEREQKRKGVTIGEST